MRAMRIQVATRRVSRELCLPVLCLVSGLVWTLGCGGRTTGGDVEDMETLGKRPDAGTGTDAGTGMDAGTGGDGGTDAGSSCSTLPHDARLGTLKLQQGFVAAEAVRFPQGINTLTAVSTRTGFTLYGVRGSDKSLYSLGPWPELAQGKTPLQHVARPEDRSSVLFLSNFLVNDGSHLLTGYVRSNSNGDGHVLVYDLARPADSRYVSAPGNTSAAGSNASASTHAFFINGTGLDGLGGPGGDVAVFGLKTQSQPWQASQLATFEPVWASISSLAAMTDNGIVVLGYFSGSDYQDHLRAISPADYDRALAEGAALPSTVGSEVYVGSSEGLFIAGFGDGLAVHRGSYSAATGVLDTQDVMWIGLGLDQANERAIVTRQPIPILRSNDSCTQVTLLSPMGRELLVGVSDKNGDRLVRLSKR